MKKPEKKQKPIGFFNVGFFLEKSIGSNQIGPNQAHPASWQLSTKEAGH